MTCMFLAYIEGLKINDGYPRHDFVETLQLHLKTLR